MEDQEIIRLFWDRSEGAVTALESKYGHLLLRIADNILRDLQDAEECVNDTYLGAWNTMPPQKPDPLCAFVCRITRNLSLKRWRSKHAGKRDVSLERPLTELSLGLGSRSAEELCTARELGRAIDRFLDTQDQESRIIFLRRYWFADSIGSIAALLGLRENNVSVKLSRLRGRLRDYLKKEGLIE